MIYIVYGIHVIVCLFLILVVLLQQGKGADLSVFGGGSTQTAFGARGAATLLHKMTVGAFVAFILTTMSIGFLQKAATGSSVMSTLEEEVTVPMTPDPTQGVLEEAVAPVDAEAADTVVADPDPAATDSDSADQ